ncbi:CDP-diacylglycerol--glycerol-3-phosphate 3-phosphatidyltransferase, mitochondrial [Trichinella pseudospiralis]|uniref:CDP-diacylglycerol--glycerol-3-phosphate 3-phosphatidyltransferase n=1 Tax=Trichinella pseudospiralis TaxID=6337 RepID=A0A0V1ERQ2_TRIPS|nr:CDP-diacylglycerol--glycerol-3-phosphate 3-phosphatidyltransferase, mitochondrial [Trichinella pseudospiralis]KRZ29249.1 CDP-diacylglycerol--glycerol-3-phosphate 3-phosphatidyltransferase, mitochondrial [Trichinella pseudospiralis]
MRIPKLGLLVNKNVKWLWDNHPEILISGVAALLALLYIFLFTNNGTCAVLYHGISQRTLFGDQKIVMLVAAKEKSMKEVGVMESTPTFKIRGNNVKIIESPSQFYEQLIVLVSQSCYRVALCSLYIGTGEMERDLIASLRKAMNEKGSLKVDILLDFNRARRGNENSCTMLSSLKHDFDHRVNVALFHSPMLRGPLKKLLSERVNEILGVQHMKVYLFDNFVLISGANLSHDYFTRRQDRYILIESADLANFYFDLIHAVSELSFQLNIDSEIILSPSCSDHPFLGSRSRYCELLNAKLKAVLSKWSQLHSLTTDEDDDTIVMPVVQFGAIGLFADREIINLIINNPSPSELFMATGYFNLAPCYVNALFESEKSCNLMIASPEANGFHGAEGFSGYVPDIYKNFAESFYRRMINKNVLNRLQLFEYKRDDWTFHAKGIWLKKYSDNKVNASVIGSTNFGYRSLNRDLETQIVLFTENEKLKDQLTAECDMLFYYCSAFKRPLTTFGHRQMPLFVLFISRWLRTCAVDPQHLRICDGVADIIARSGVNENSSSLSSVPMTINKCLAQKNGV